MTRAISRVVLAAAAVCMTAALAQAQQAASTTTSTETKTFEIIAVNGNQLVVKLPEGTRELTVPSDFRFTVNGQSLAVGQLKPGMKGSATITTRTTSIPVTVTEVKNGTVISSSGTSMVVRTDKGMQMFTQSEVDKRGVTIMRNGEPAKMAEFQANDRISAMIITSKPPRIVTEKEVNASLTPAAAAAPASSGAPAAKAAPAPKPAPAASSTSTSAAAPAAAPAKELPKTASSWPLLGLASVLSLAMGLGFTIRRRLVS